MLHLSRAFQQDGDSFKYGKLEAEKRKELRTALVQEGLELGPEFRKAVLMRTMQDLPDVDATMNLLTPFHTGDVCEFDISNPTLRSCSDLPDVDFATCFLKLAIHTRLVPEIRKGKSRRHIVEELCQRMSEMTTQAQQAPDQKIAMTGALADVQEICKYFLTLCEPFSLADDGNQTLNVLSCVRGSRVGAKALVKHAVDESVFWLDLEKDTRSCQVAARTFGKELRSCSANLAIFAEKSVEDALGRLPLWLDNLPRTLLSRVTEQLMAAIDHEVSSWQKRAQEARPEDADSLKETYLPIFGWVERALELLQGSSHEASLKSTQSQMKATMNNLKEVAGLQTLQKAIDSILAEELASGGCWSRCLFSLTRCLAGSTVLSLTHAQRHARPHPTTLPPAT